MRVNVIPLSAAQATRKALGEDSVWVKPIIFLTCATLFCVALVSLVDFYFF